MNDNDPFSLGDSDDEKEFRSKDARSDDLAGHRIATETSNGSDNNDGDRSNKESG